jgi:hypothetical protein
MRTPLELRSMIPPATASSHKLWKWAAGEAANLDDEKNAA